MPCRWSLSCKAKDSGGLVILSGCLIVDCLRSFCLVKSKGPANLVALGPFSTILHDVTVNTVVLIGCLGVHGTGCSGKTTLSPHMPSSSRARTLKTYNFFCIGCPYAGGAKFASSCEATCRMPHLSLCLPDCTYHD